MLHIELLATGTKAPAWITAGLTEYQRRLRGCCRFSLREIRAASRRKEGRNKPGTATLCREAEGGKMFMQLAGGAKIIALHVEGESWDTEQLAHNLADWSREHSHVQLLVGGPDGLGQQCLNAADKHWSLSPLTFPHYLIRILVVEQIYRALMLNSGHPYHR